MEVAMSDHQFQDYYAKTKSQCSEVWKYFLKGVGLAENTAKCRKCNSVLKVSGGSTKGLHNHIKKHNKELRSQKNKMELELSVAGESLELTNEGFLVEETGNARKKRKKDYSVFNGGERSFEATLARMVARDGLPFRIFCISSDLRAALMSMGFTDIPSSPGTIRYIVQNYSKHLRCSAALEISKLVSEGERMSLTIDEWTSVGSKRYLNLNVHSCNKSWSLGLIRIQVSMSAVKGLELVEKKLAEIGLSLEKNIISITTDGTDALLRIAHLTNVENQVCFARGIQLAVLDVLYKNKTDSGKNSSGDEQDTKTYVVEEPENSDNSSSSSEEEEETDFGFSVEVESVGDILGQQIELKEDIQALVEKVRKVVKLIKRSSENSNSLYLINDKKTRWNSLLAMLERFHRQKEIIINHLVDIEANINFLDKDFQLIEDIVAVLEPIKLVVEALSSRSANLLTADTMFKFMFEQLEAQQPCALAKEMELALIKRIGERRTNLSGVLQYLHNPVTKEEDEDYFKLFEYPSKTVICNVITSLVDRLASREIPEAFSSEIDCLQETSSKAEEAQFSMKEQLKLAIMKTLTEEATLQSQIAHTEGLSHKGLMAIIKKEMSLFEDCSSRGYHLELVYKYLRSIHPTSIEADRAFSNAGYLRTQIRSGLQDSTLDDLVFLRSTLNVNIYENERPDGQ